MLTALDRLVPRRSWAALALAACADVLAYYGARLVTGGWRHYDLTGALDALIPFWPPAAAVYLGAFAFWAVNYILLARQSRAEVCRFFAADLLSRAVCLAFFLLLPTTNVRPAVEGPGFWEAVMRLIYRMDTPDNLFPSIHCLASWFCAIGLRGKKRIPAWYRAFSFCVAAAVCASTGLTRQHVAWDVLGGVLLAELCYAVAGAPRVWQTYGRMLDAVNRRLFGRERGSDAC